MYVYLTEVAGLPSFSLVLYYFSFSFPEESCPESGGGHPCVAIIPLLWPPLYCEHPMSSIVTALYLLGCIFHSFASYIPLLNGHDYMDSHKYWLPYIHFVQMYYRWIVTEWQQWQRNRGADIPPTFKSYCTMKGRTVII